MRSSQNKKSRSNPSVSKSFNIQRLEDRRLMSATLSVSESLMVFNAVNGSASPVETLTLTNSGDAALSLTGLSVVNDPNAPTQNGAQFTLPNSSSEPSSLAPGASFGLQVQYTASATGLQYAIIDIDSSDPVTPVNQVELHGIGTAGLGGGNQPSLELILQAYDEPNYNDVGETNINSAYYPNPPGSNSDEVSLQELVAANTAAPVTIDVLASFTAQSTKPYTLGWYSPSNPSNTKQTLFFTPTSEAQSVYVQPEGVTSFNPGSAVFGFYNPSATVQVNNKLVTGYTQDDLNTYDTTNDRKFRFFPYENSSGQAVPNTYIMTSTEWYNPSGYDFTNIVAIVSNVQAAPGAPTGPTLSITNPDALPGSNTLIFNRIQGTNPSVGDTVHNTNTITLENTGAGSLTIDNVTVASTTTDNTNSTQYELVNPPTFPLTLTAGQTQTIEVEFILSQVNANGHSQNETNSAGNGGGGSDYPGILTITSNDANAPTTTLPLEGWWQEHSENSNEPSLQTIVNLMAGWDTDIAPSGTNLLIESTSPTAAPTYYGQETVSGYWAEADTTQPVSVIQLDAYHTEGATSGLRYFAQGNTGSYSTIISTGSDVGQTFFPSTSGGVSPATASFSTTENFGFEVLNPNTYSDDSLNVGDDSGGHLIRWYPVISSTGNPVPNTYLLAIDYPTGTDENFDFQDNVYLISNIRPVASKTVSAPQTTGGASAPEAVGASDGSTGVTVQWEPVINDTTLTGYDIYSSLSPTSGFSLLNMSPVSGDSYLDTTAAAGETLYYKVAAVDSLGVGLGTETSFTTSGTAANSLQNVAIGETPAGSVTTVTTGSAYTVTAGGPGVTGTSDGFEYLETTQTGNFDVAVQVSSLTAAGNFSTAGIMARDGLGAGAANVYMSASPVNYRFKDRTTDGGSEGVDVGTAATNYPDVWVRLTRVGDVFTGYTSPDGIVWTMLDSVTLSTFPATCYLGLAVASNTTGQTTTAQLASYGTTQTYNGPVTTPQTYTVGNGQTASEPVLAGDEDPTGTIVPGTFTITTPPNQGGTASFNATSGLLSYTPAAGFTGVETLAYTVADSNNVTSSPTTITFDVVSGGPIGVPSTFQATAGQVAQLNVLTNDTDATGTIDPETVAVVTQPASGATVTVNSSTGVITYLAPTTFSGTDTFTYTVADNMGEISVPTTVTIDVAPSTTGGLTTVPVTVSAIGGKSTTITVLTGDTDTTGTILPGTVAIVSAPNHGGTATANSDGTITYKASSSFTGVETFSYTVQDSAGYTSAATLVTVNVANPNIAPIVTSVSPTTTANGSVTVNVASDATTNVGLDLSSIAIGNSPANGTASVDGTTGLIIYTPNANFVGPDSFTYTVADKNGHTSNTATVSVNVGVTIGNAAGNDKSLTFTSAGAVITTLSLNKGSAIVCFTNTGTLSVNKKGQATVTGGSLQISSLTLSNTTAASTLSISARGLGALDIGGITDASPIKTISAPRAVLSGTVNLKGVTTLQVLEAIGANINNGTGMPAGFSIIAGTVDDTTLISSVPIKSLHATSWTSVNGSSSIQAPSINSLVTTGNFQAKLTTTGGSTSLNTVHIGGQVGVGVWTVNGNARSLYAGSTATGWAGLNVSGNLAAMTIATGNLPSNITAGSINALRVAGTITADITTTGNLLLLQAGQLVDSIVDVGTTASSVSAATSGNIGTATLGTLHLTGRAANTFSNSSVIADKMNSVTTGPANLGSSSAEGLAATTIKAAALTLSSGLLHLNAKELLSEGAIQAFLNQHSATAGTFLIDIL
jgi:hypothetical protein